MTYDDKITGKRPAVLMIHAREGMTPKTLQLAETWAKLGYVSFAADIFGYGEGVLPKDVPEMQAQTAIYTKDRALMRARAQAGFDALIKNPMVDPSRVALIGYCFGGAVGVGVGVEFGATGAPLVANVSIHGSFRDHAEGWAKNAKGMYLILHGAEDEGFPLPTVDKVVQELRGAKVPFQLEVYSGTGHGFSNYSFPNAPPTPSCVPRSCAHRPHSRPATSTAAPNKRHSIGWCSSTMRRSQPPLQAYLSSSKTSLRPFSNAAYWRTDSCACAVRAARASCWSPLAASCAASAPRAARGAWRRVPRIWWIKSYRMCRCRRRKSA